MLPILYGKLKLILFCGTREIPKQIHGLLNFAIGFACPFLECLGKSELESKNLWVLLDVHYGIGYPLRDPCS